MKNSRKNRLVFSAEDVYRLLEKEEWSVLLNFITQNADFIEKDPMLRHAVEFCLQMFFSNITNFKDEEDRLRMLDLFYFSHQRKHYQLSDERFRIIVRESVRIWKDRDIDQAHARAILFPDDEICQSVIKDCAELRPKIVSHSQSGTINVTENKNISNIDGRRSLFKSKQELEFFYGVRDAYPNYFVFPNVALSSVFDFDLIADVLSDEVRRYFFMAVIDCVVFDFNKQLFLPKLFFELDSPYHDLPEQQKKDRFKDNIFSAAGQKLYRIRRVNQDRGSFARLIKELVDNN